MPAGIRFKARTIYRYERVYLRLTSGGAASFSKRIQT